MLIKSKPNTARMYLGPCQDITQDSDRPFLISYLLNDIHTLNLKSWRMVLCLNLKIICWCYHYNRQFFHFLKFLIFFILLKLWFWLSFLPSLSIRVCAPLSPDGDLIVFAKRSDATCLLQVTGIIFISIIIIINNIIIIIKLEEQWRLHQKKCHIFAIWTNLSILDPYM